MSALFIRQPDFGVNREDWEYIALFAGGGQAAVAFASARASGWDEFDCECSIL
jgi:hypothetical protein